MTWNPYFSNSVRDNLEYVKEKEKRLEKSVQGNIRGHQEALPSVWYFQLQRIIYSVVLKQFTFFSEHIHRIVF